MEEIFREQAMAQQRIHQVERAKGFIQEYVLLSPHTNILRAFIVRFQFDPKNSQGRS